MFFTELLDSPADDGRRPAGVAAQVIFDGDPPGSFRLDLDLPAAQSAAANFLGEDPEELTPQKMNEVVCELANMICGSVLSRIESSAVFRLAPPEIAAEDSPRPESPAGASFQASLGGGALRAEIRMERTVCTGIDELGF